MWKQYIQLLEAQKQRYEFKHPTHLLYSTKQTQTQSGSARMYGLNTIQYQKEILT